MVIGLPYWSGAAQLQQAVNFLLQATPGRTALPDLPAVPREPQVKDLWGTCKALVKWIRMSTKIYFELFSVLFKYYITCECVCFFGHSRCWSNECMNLLMVVDCFTEISVTMAAWSQFQGALHCRRIWPTTIKKLQLVDLIAPELMNRAECWIRGTMWHQNRSRKALGPRLRHT